MVVFSVFESVEHALSGEVWGGDKLVDENAGEDKPGRLPQDDNGN